MTRPDPARREAAPEDVSEARESWTRRSENALAMFARTEAAGALALLAAGADHIAEDVDGADLSAVAGTPSFLINGRLHRGAYDRATLTAAVRLAKTQAFIAG